MLTLPDAIVAVLMPFATLFSKPTWRKAQLLLVGAILTTGQRTVAQALRVMGRSQDHDYARYHEVLNRAVWSPRRSAGILLGLLLQHLAPGHGPWCLASTRPWSDAEVLASRPKGPTETRPVPIGATWSRPAVCAGYP